MIKRAILIWANMVQCNEDNVGVSLYTWRRRRLKLLCCGICMCLRGSGPSCTEDIEWMALHTGDRGEGSHQVTALTELNFPRLYSPANSCLQICLQRGDVACTHNLFVPSRAKTWVAHITTSLSPTVPLGHTYTFSLWGWVLCWRWTTLVSMG